MDVDALPDGVQLICEAGTGFNNVDLDAAARRGITVCNVPTYSTDAVAHLVITYVLNFASSVVPRARALARGDTSAFTSFTALGAYPHFELQGKTIGGRRRHGRHRRESRREKRASSACACSSGVEAREREFEEFGTHAPRSFSRASRARAVHLPAPTSGFRPRAHRRKSRVAPRNAPRPALKPTASARHRAQPGRGD